MSQAENPSDQGGNPMSLKTVSGVIRDVSFSDPKRQEIFVHLSEAFGRRPLESLRKAAERVVAKGYPEDEPILKAARIVLDLEQRRLSMPGSGEKVAWEGLAAARAELMEPGS